jgi:hypothetical protein
MGLVKKLIGVTGVLFLVCLLLISTPPKAVSFDMGEGRLVYDDGAVRVFALPGPEGSAESSAQAAVGPAAVKAKVKILTCHVTDTPDTNYVTWPWIAVGASMIHVVFFEITGKSDYVRLTYTLTGPEFPETVVVKTDWMGPLDPGLHYSSELTYGTGYTTEGFHKMTVKGIPQGNKLYGTSTDSTVFHIIPAEVR